MTTSIRVGPFEWKRNDHGGNEVWTLVVPQGLKLTHWCLKNYGGHPNASSGFSGWRLVSGGPFTAAGGWASREDAMVGVVPWLMDYLRQDLRARMEDCERMAAGLAAFDKLVEA